MFNLAVSGSRPGGADRRGLEDGMVAVWWRDGWLCWIVDVYVYIVFLYMHVYSLA